MGQHVGLGCGSAHSWPAAGRVISQASPACLPAAASDPHRCRMSSSDSEPLEEREADWEGWDAEEDAVRCLFSDRAFATADEALDADAQQTGFDLRLFRAQVPRLPSEQPPLPP